MVLQVHAVGCSEAKVRASATFRVMYCSQTCGSGRQHLGALFNLVAYYVLALPIGITLAFHPHTHLGLEGLWMGESVFIQLEYFPLRHYHFAGQVIALFIVGLGEYGAVWLGTDWDKEVQKGIERNEAEAMRRALYERAVGISVA